MYTKIKDFNSFVNYNKLNEKNEIKDTFILKNALDDFKKFLHYETNEIDKNGLIIHMSHNFSSKDLKSILSTLKIPSLWMNGTEPLNKYSLFELLKNGNNQCIVFNDFPTDVIEKKIMTSNIISNSFNNRYDIPGITDIFIPKSLNYDNDTHIYFRGVFIILTDDYKDKFENAPYFKERFEYIETK